MSENVLRWIEEVSAFAFFQTLGILLADDKLKKNDCEMEINLIHLQSCIMHKHSTVTQAQYLHTSTSQFAMSSKWTNDHNHVDFFSFPCSMFAFVHHLRAAHKLWRSVKQTITQSMWRAYQPLFVHSISQIFACQLTNNALFFRVAAAGFFSAVVDDFQYVFKRSFSKHTIY